MDFTNPADKDFYLGRVFFTAPEYRTVIADYSQLEPRVFAIVYRKPNTISRRDFLKKLRRNEKLTNSDANSLLRRIYKTGR